MFLMSEEGKKRSFHVDTDENGNKIGIEASPEFLKAEESDKNHAAYLERQKAESGVEIISANIIVRDSETEVELIETVADITVNVEMEALKAICARRWGSSPRQNMTSSITCTLRMSL